MLILILYLHRLLSEQLEYYKMQFETYHDYCHRYEISEENEITILEDDTNRYVIFKDVSELNLLLECLDKLTEGRIISAKNVIGLAQRIYPNLPYILVSPYVSDSDFEAYKSMMLERENKGDYI